VISTGGNDVYVVGREGAADLLIPAIAQVVTEVDVDAQHMTVHLLEGLR
ncbi:MAG TPA: 16S rRNA processing protein RimM, partial [Dehalococcoidia bacterium]|nr:16S rRNA processing protein RimM [Dehalococcoidia bacterium]